MTLYPQLIFYSKYFCSYVMLIQCFKYECLTNKYICQFDDLDQNSSQRYQIKVKNK